MTAWAPRPLASSVAVFAIACSASAPPASPSVLSSASAPSASAPTPGAIIQVRYSLAADVFEVLDNTSAWYRKKCDPEYRAAWESDLGLTPEDERWFERYAEIRKRHYPMPPEEEGPPILFAPEKHDVLADAFYAAESVSDALAALRPHLPPEDVDTLQRFYAAMLPRAQRWFDESAAFVEIGESLSARLDQPDTRAFVERMARFYGVTPAASFTVLLVWWPPVGHVTASSRGSTLLMKYNPVRHRDRAGRDVDVPIHELAHFTSSRQSAEQKRDLSAAFLSSCASHPEPSPALLEEPLAVAQQKVFLSFAEPSRLDLEAPWYGDAPWIGHYAKRIYPNVRARYEEGRPMDQAWMRSLGARCMN